MHSEERRLIMCTISIHSIPSVVVVFFVLFLRIANNFFLHHTKNYHCLFCTIHTSVCIIGHLQSNHRGVLPMHS